jgi:hypothetical protein
MYEISSSLVSLVFFCYQFLWSPPLVLGFSGLGSSPSVSGFSGFLLQFWVSVVSGLSPSVMGFFGVVLFWVSVVFYFCCGFSLVFSFCFRILWSAPSVLGFSDEVSWGDV